MVDQQDQEFLAQVQRVLATAWRLFAARDQFEEFACVTHGKTELGPCKYDNWDGGTAFLVRVAGHRGLPSSFQVFQSAIGRVGSSLLAPGRSLPLFVYVDAGGQAESGEAWQRSAKPRIDGSREAFQDVARRNPATASERLPTLRGWTDAAHNARLTTCRPS